MKPIQHYRREHKAMCEQLDQLTRELDEAASRSNEQIQLAVAEHRAEFDRALAASEERTNLLRDTITKLAARVDEQRRERDLFVQRIGELQLHAFNAEQERDGWKAKAASATPAIAEAAAQVAELAELLDKVRGRMKRRELEAAAAIKNRQVLAGVIPAFDRRR